MGDYSYHSGRAASDLDADRVFMGEDHQARQSVEIERRQVLTPIDMNTRSPRANDRKMMPSKRPFGQHINTELLILSKLGCLAHFPTSGLTQSRQSRRSVECLRPWTFSSPQNNISTPLRSFTMTPLSVIATTSIEIIPLKVSP